MIKTFDEMVLFARTGLNPRQNFRLGHGDNAYITIKNIKNNRLVIDGNTDVVDDEAIKMIHKRSQIKKGDILFASIGRMGDMYIIEKEPDGWDINESVFAFTLDTDIIRQKYFYYIFKTQSILNYLTANSSGSTFKSIKMNQLKKMTFDIPMLEEQDRIVEILDKISDIIFIRKEELELLDNLIKSRFVEMFGDPVSNPMGWKQGDMSSVCVKITDGEHGSVPRSRRGRIFLNAKHIRSDGNIDFYTATYIDDVAHERIYKRCNPEQGDILLTTTGTIGNVAIVPPIEEFSMDRGITLLKLDKTLCECTFIANLLRCKSMQNIMKANIHASAIGHLFLNKVMKLPVIVPPIELQNQFADFVIQTTKLKFEIQKSLDETQTLMDALMQEYFG